MTTPEAQLSFVQLPSSTINTYICRHNINLTAWGKDRDGVAKCLLKQAWQFVVENITHWVLRNRIQTSILKYSWKREQVLSTALSWEKHTLLAQITYHVLLLYQQQQHGIRHSVVGNLYFTKYTLKSTELWPKNEKKKKDRILWFIIQQKRQSKKLLQKLWI